MCLVQPVAEQDPPDGDTHAYIVHRLRAVGKNNLSSVPMVNTAESIFRKTGCPDQETIEKFGVVLRRMMSLPATGPLMLPAFSQHYVLSTLSP